MKRQLVAAALDEQGKQVHFSLLINRTLYHFTVTRGFDKNGAPQGYILDQELEVLSLVPEPSPFRKLMNALADIFWGESIQLPIDLDT